MSQAESYEIINRVDIPDYLSELWNNLSNFVEKKCSNRDISHGFLHMKQVAHTSLYIQSKDYPDMSQKMIKVLIASAWLHDVADHKYDPDGNLQKEVNEFLESKLPKYKDYVQLIIKCSSFSFENNNPNWTELFDKRKYISIRNILSDADKLDALGSRGLTRIIEYANHINRNVQEHMQHIATNRILVLKDKYIRTETGYQLATNFHTEFDELFKLNFLCKFIYLP